LRRRALTQNRPPAGHAGSLVRVSVPTRLGLPPTMPDQELTLQEQLEEIGAQLDWVRGYL